MAVAGHDIGGAIAQHLLVKGTIEVERLALVNSVMYESWPVPGVARYRDPEVARATSVEELLAARRQSVTTAVARPITDAEIAEYLDPWSCNRSSQSILYPRSVSVNDRERSCDPALPDHLDKWKQYRCRVRVNSACVCECRRAMPLLRNHRDDPTLERAGRIFIHGTNHLGNGRRHERQRCFLASCIGHSGRGPASIGLVVSIVCMLLPRSRYAKQFRDEPTVSAKH